MMTPPIPANETWRLAALHATSLFGTGPEEAFDRITRLAAKLFHVPTALISLVGNDTQWFKSRCGFAARETARDVSFCGHAILTDKPLVVPDAANDPRFADNPIVTGAPHVRFYAGVQLYSVERAKLGTLCILDTQPREIGDAELEELHELARMVEELIYHRQLALAAQQLQEGLQGDVSDTQLARAAGQVEFLLTHDTLTGLANRQALLRAVRDRVPEWRGHGVGAALAYLNVDRFRRLNEALGHLAGDEALVTVARTLQAGLGAEGMLARTGNDEFAFLIDVPMLPNTPDAPAALQTRLARLMHDVTHAISWAGTEVAITCSIGYARFPQDASDADSLLGNAAAAMRHAKRLGGARIEAYAPGQRQEFGRRMAIESQLRRALERGELLLHYQPKIALVDERLAGFEALLRWHHPEYGMVSPEEFVPIAEETGMIGPIGEWIVRTAMTQMADWRAAGLPQVPVAVNLSARQFLQGDVVALVEEMLKLAGVRSALFELELTESVSMAEPERSLEIMHRLKALGIALSIDDFGTGYSSFGYLKRLPISKLKIDKSFVHDMVHSSDACAIVRAIVAMAHSLGLCVVAEGVELAAQAAALRAAGCDQAQGYFYARPLSPAQVADYLAGSVALPAPVKKVSAG